MARLQGQGGFLRQAADRVRALALIGFLRAYPWLHVVQEGMRFAYQLAYLLDSTPYYSPVLHLLRQRIVRVSGQELVRYAHALLVSIGQAY